MQAHQRVDGAEEHGQGEQVQVGEHLALHDPQREVVARWLDLYSVGAESFDSFKDRIAFLAHAAMQTR